MTSAIFISTYNWPKALDKCLESINNQTVLPTEIVICDDGSGQETVDLIARWQAQSKTPIKHIWQEDNGFQLAKIRNKGFAASACEYCIQIDGDIILHENFVKDHLSFARKNAFVSGSRVLLSQEVTALILENKNPLINRIHKKNKLNEIHQPLLQSLLGNIYKTRGRHKYYVKGCNMAFWRNDLIKVNGYNENFVGWGKEDSEIAIRLINAGVKKRFLKFGGIGYHLHHNLASRELEASNQLMMERTISEKISRAELGLSQYL